MNESGQVGRPAGRGATASTILARLVVVHDELDLARRPAQGEARRRTGRPQRPASRSRPTCTPTDFARVRIGVGKPPSSRARARPRAAPGRQGRPGRARRGRRRRRPTPSRLIARRRRRGGHGALQRPGVSAHELRRWRALVDARSPRTRRVARRCVGRAISRAARCRTRPEPITLAARGRRRATARPARGRRADHGTTPSASERDLAAFARRGRGRALPGVGDPAVRAGEPRRRDDGPAAAGCLWTLRHRRGAAR